MEGDDSFFAKFRPEITAAIISGIVMLVTAVFSFFSETISDRLATGAKNAKARYEQYPEIIKPISDYIWASNDMAEYLAGCILPEDKEDFELQWKSYNSAIVKIRTNEFVNRYVLSRYWGNEIVVKYDYCMKSIYSLDADFHKLNKPFDDYIKVVLKKKLAPNACGETREAFSWKDKVLPVVDSIRKKIPGMFDGDCKSFVDSLSKLGN